MSYVMLLPFARKVVFPFFKSFLHRLNYLIIFMMPMEWLRYLERKIICAYETTESFLEGKSATGLVPYGGDK